MRDILILVYKFPPMGGVGSRRWAKFAKYLTRIGYRVHVVTTAYPYRDGMNWSADVAGNPAIEVHRTRTDYPAVLFKQDRSFAELCLTAFHLYLHVPWRFPLDAAEGWANYAIPFASRLMREKKIGTLIASGPPSTIHHLAALVKSENPRAVLVQDYRDLWNSNRDYAFRGPHGPIRSLRVKARSVAMEALGIRQADHVLTVTEDLRRDLAGAFPDCTDRIHTLYNGYDPDDYAGDLPAPAPGAFEMVYLGRFGRNPALRPRAIELLAEALRRLDADETIRALRIDLHSELDATYFRGSPNYALIRERFRFRPLVPPAEVAGIVAAHPFCLSINSPLEPFAFGTKIFDYFAVGRRILHISEGGELSDLLAARGHFVARYDADELVDRLLRMKAALRDPAPPAPGGFPEFDLRRLTGQLAGWLDAPPGRGGAGTS